MKLSPEQHSLIDRYEVAVMAALSTISLTGASTRQEFHEKQVQDALLLADAVPSDAKRIIDVGSGNGIPGLIWSILWPERKLFLLDSNTKKCGFLESFCVFNKIKNVTILCARAEFVGHEKDMRACFDVAVAKAFAPLTVTLECTAPLVTSGGIVIVPRGTSSTEDLDHLADACKKLHIVQQDSYPYNLNDISMQGLRFHVEDVPLEYPRRSPAKKPL